MRRSRPAPAYVVYGLIETRPSSPFFNQIRYIGQTANLPSRIASYRRARGSNPHLNAWLRACPNFRVTILQRVGSRHESHVAEVSWIARSLTRQSPGGLNVHPGGSLVSSSRRRR